MAAGARSHDDPGQGLLTFAAVYLFIAGGMNVLWGAAALANKANFRESGLVWSNLDTWGWIAIVVGVLQVVAAFMTQRRTFAGQWLAGVIATLAIFVNFLSLGAYPVWSIIALVANGLVIWAVTAHGDDFD